MIRSCFIALIVLLPLGSMAQGWLPSGSRSMSMGNASVTLTDVWGYFNNPAATAGVRELQAGISYENRFLLKELQTQAVAVAIPLKTGVLSAGGHMYGYTQFRSYKGGLGYSMPLGEKLFAGVQLNYEGIQLNENYGSRNSMTAEAGILAELTSKWKVGVSVFNLGRQKLSDYEDDRFSTIMRLGTSYMFSKKFLLAAEFEKDLEYKSRIKVGMDYEIVDKFFWRMGFATARSEFSFGFSYHFKKIYLDLGSSYDQILGWSPNFSLTYVKSKE